MADSYASRLAKAKLLLRSTGPNAASRGAAASTVREYERTIEWDGTLDATTARNYCVDDTTAQPMRVTRVCFVPDGSLTASATNYRVMTVVFNNGNGGSDTILFRANTTPTANGGTGNLVASRRFAFTEVNAVDIPEGSMVQFKVSHAGTGGILPIGAVIIKADLKE